MRPMEGIRIVELATWFATPRAACHLADMGAEVIKVEHPSGGDPVRGIKTIASVGVPTTGLNWAFELDNRNKKSLAVDLRQEQGREIVYRLVEKSDVFVTNFLPNVLKKLGMDYERIVKVNHKIIFAQASACGPKGPDKDKDGFDAIAFARTGIASAMGETDSIKRS